MSGTPKVTLVARSIGIAAVGLFSAGTAWAQTTCFGIPDDNPAVCSGHGACLAPDTCSCDAGYAGPQCQSVTCFTIPDNDPTVCSGHGACIGPDTCDCQVGFVGDECQSLVIPTVTIGNPGNTDDTHGDGYGGVGYVYSIGEFEVTAGQYTAFLNAVAATDTYELYNTDMWTNIFGCKIERSGSSGTYTYSVAGDRANRPVNYMTWGDAARFCNWLHNAQPTGAQDLTTTEDGSYHLNGAATDAELLAVVREPHATWVIPSEDEWYKAAYHYNDGVTGNYFDYPTSSDTVPGYVNDSGNLSGTGTPFTEGGTDPGNYATSNADEGTSGIGSPYYVTEVGEWENSDSPYGTFDQAGNVWEWNETVLYGSQGCLRGGAYNADDYFMPAEYRYAMFRAANFRNLGFRVALAQDCNGNGIVDECDIACGEVGGPCDVDGCGLSDDTNGDGIPDECGACCTAAGCTQTTDTLCVGPSKAKYNGDGTTCEEACPAGIPTVTSWGLVVMTLLVLAAGTLVLTKRRSASAG